MKVSVVDLAVRVRGVHKLLHDRLVELGRLLTRVRAEGQGLWVRVEGQGLWVRG